MERGLINQELNDRLNTIVSDMFMLNRLWDSAMSSLSVNFVLTNFEKTYHVPQAHRFLAYADKNSEVQAAYNNITTYLATPEGKKDYLSPLEFFELNITKLVEVQKHISDTIDFAVMQSDEDLTGTGMAVASALKRFMRVFAGDIAQAILLRDKSEAYGQEPWQLQLFDRDCDKFLILSEDIPKLVG